MRAIINFLEGRKTYIVAIVLGVLNVLVALNVINPETLEQINIVLVALGIGALRSSISKV